MPKILVRPKLIKFLSGGRARAMALYPFILVEKDIYMADAVLMRHEEIHLRQQVEMAVLLFYVWYLLEFLVRWIQFRDFYTAYMNISFEREAYFYESSQLYLSLRKPWEFLHFL